MECVIILMVKVYVCVLCCIQRILPTLTHIILLLYNISNYNMRRFIQAIKFYYIIGNIFQGLLNWVVSVHHTYTHVGTIQRKWYHKHKCLLRTIEQEPLINYNEYRWACRWMVG